MGRIEKIKVKSVNKKIKLGIVAGIIAAASFQLAGVNGIQPAKAATGTPGGTPDYWTTPNYANSPLPEFNSDGTIKKGTGIRKFVDTLPGLGSTKANNLGQYIPIAIPDTTTYPGTDYYE